MDRAKFAANDEFDVFDDALMHDLIGDAHLEGPVQALLEDLWTIELAEASFGADPLLCLQRLMPHLRELRDRVREAM